jgi:hypothetical protein
MTGLTATLTGKIISPTYLLLNGGAMLRNEEYFQNSLSLPCSILDSSRILDSYWFLDKIEQK